MTEKTVRLDTIQKQSFYFSQECISCENTRRLPEGVTYCNTPWMCDECREAIAYLKQLKVESKRDPLEPILD